MTRLSKFVRGVMTYAGGRDDEGCREDVAAEGGMADPKLEILAVLRSFDDSGRPAPPVERIAALARQRMSAATAALSQLEASGDIKSADRNSFEITERGRTTLARAERDGAI